MIISPRDNRVNRHQLIIPSILYSCCNNECTNNYEIHRKISVKWEQYTIVKINKLHIYNNIGSLE
jgi:hypothetical protein